MRHPSTAQAIRFEYHNYKGEQGQRHATPISVRFGSSQWHSKSQWLMKAYDHDKQAEREFAMSDCDFT
jgi:predicted DNA-binding transcriptional regulator YafY